MFFHLKISGLVFPTNILMCTSIFEPDRERWYPMLNCPRTRVFSLITSLHSLSTQIALYFAPRFLLPPRVCSPVTEWYIRTKKITGISESRSLMCVVTKCKASYLQNGTKWSQWCSASVALWHSVINHTTLCVSQNSIVVIYVGFLRIFQVHGPELELSIVCIWFMTKKKTICNSAAWFIKSQLQC